MIIIVWVYWTLDGEQWTAISVGKGFTAGKVITTGRNLNIGWGWGRKGLRSYNWMRTNLECGWGRERERERDAQIHPDCRSVGSKRRTPDSVCCRLFSLIKHKMIMPLSISSDRFLLMTVCLCVCVCVCVCSSNCCSGDIMWELARPRFSHFIDFHYSRRRQGSLAQQCNRLIVGKRMMRTSRLLRYLVCLLHLYWVTHLEKKERERKKRWRWWRRDTYMWDP